MDWLYSTDNLVRYLKDDNNIWYRVEFRYLDDNDYCNRDENDKLLPRRKWRIIAHDIMYPNSKCYPIDDYWTYKDDNGKPIIPKSKRQLTEKELDYLNPEYYL